MAIKLNSVEIRILGCLIEKQLTTPDYYPLTLNSLTAACNQKSNREPVMQLSETEIQKGVASLIEKYLVREKQLPGSRTAKYEHKLSGTLTKEFDFTLQQLGVLAILFLRGPQTVGEIKGRTQRMADFNDLSQVEACLQSLVNHQKGPFVAALPREPGRREIRYTHLLLEGSEAPDISHEAASVAPASNVSSNNEIQQLREEVQNLKSEFEELKQLVNELLN